MTEDEQRVLINDQQELIDAYRMIERHLKQKLRWEFWRGLFCGVAAVLTVLMLL